jgi:WD40 repeat protein
MSRRAWVLLILLLLTGAGIAAVVVVTRPGGFVPGVFVLERSFPLRHDVRPVRAAFVPGKNSVLFGAEWEPITLFDLATGAQREFLSGPSFGNFLLNADATSAAILMPGPGPASSELRIYDLASGKVLKTFPDRRGSACWTWSPDGRRIAFAVTWMVFVLDLDRGVTEHHPGSENHEDHIGSMTFSPDGRLLGIGTWKGEVSLWRTDSWTLSKEFDLGSNPDPKLGRNADCHVAFSPDGTFFAAGGGASYGTLDVPNSSIYSGALRVWRTSDHTLVHSLDTGRPVVSLSFSPDASTLAYFAWRSVHVVDLRTGKELCQLEAPTGRNPTVEFDRDGRLLTLDERGGIRIWKRAPKR